jgi:nucleotide-binding universal stress UspA family protein
MRPHMVVGVDGSDASISSLRHAAKFATSFSGSVEAVHVCEYPASVVGYFPPDWSPADDARKILSDATGAVFGDAPPAWVEQTVGSRGHGGFTGLLLGTVGSVCAEYSSCPTLVMHGDRLVGPESGR